MHATVNQIRDRERENELLDNFFVWNLLTRLIT